MKIEIKNGELTISGDTDTLNALLKPHGLHIAPLPAPETEAERLVEMAASLPDEAIETWGAMRNLTIDHEDDIRMGTVYYSPDEFSTILLGVMAAYVGTERCAIVHRIFGGTFQWCVGHTGGDAPDLLTAYRDCCLAIARKRGGA